METERYESSPSVRGITPPTTLFEWDTRFISRRPMSPPKRGSPMSESDSLSHRSTPSPERKPWVKKTIMERACIAGDVHAMLQLIQTNHAAIHEKGHFGSVLVAAAAGRDEAIVLILLDEGVDPDAQNERYGTALHVAIQGSDREMVELLLDRGASIDIRGLRPRQGTPLRWACTLGHSSIVRLLLERGASFSATYLEEEPSLLHLATARADEDMVQLLLDHGVDVHEPNEDALVVAAEMNHIEITQILLDHGMSPDHAGNGGGSPLEAACAHNSIEVARLLIDRGADANAYGHGNGGGPLIAAVASGHKDIVALLLSSGANANIEGPNRGAALHAAAAYNLAPIVKLLLDNGADVDATSGGRSSAFEAAVAHGQYGVVQTILKHDPSLLSRQKDRLHLIRAAFWGYPSIVRLFLAQGANVNEAGGRLVSALYAASISGEGIIIEILLQHGADPNCEGGLYGNPLQAAASFGYSVEALLSSGANINFRGGLFGTALQAASGAGWHLETVWELVAGGADLEVIAGPDRTALQAASQNGHIDIVHSLLSYGADPNSSGEPFIRTQPVQPDEDAVLAPEYRVIADADSRNIQRANKSIRKRHANALQAAAASGHEDVVLALLDSGANPNTVGGYYGSALQAAAAMGHVNVVRMLLDRGASIDLPGGCLGGALPAAAARGQDGVVWELLGAYGEVSSSKESLELSLDFARKRMSVMESALEGGRDEAIFPEDEVKEWLRSDSRYQACERIVNMLQQRLG